MKQQIEDGLNAARMDGVLRLAESKVGDVADYVLRALADREIEPMIETLPAETVIASLSTSDMVALIAKGATQPGTNQFNPIITQETYMGGGWQDETYLAWALQRMFGVWAVASPHGQAVYMKAAGREQALHTFNSVLNALLTAGRPHGSSPLFWTTLGNLIANGTKAKSQADDNKYAWEAARAECVRMWGNPTIVKTPTAAENGTPEYEAAAKTLAEVAL